MDDADGSDASTLVTVSDGLLGSEEDDRGLARSRPKPHTDREAYGFVMYLSTIIAAIFWTLWTLVPDEYLDRLGIVYRPRKTWAIILPGFALASVYFYIAAKQCSDFLAVSSDDSWMIVTDEKSNVAECPACLELCTCDLSQRKCYRHRTEEIPIHLVNKFLYDDAYAELSGLEA